MLDFCGEWHIIKMIKVEANESIGSPKRKDPLPELQSPKGGFFVPSGRAKASPFGSNGDDRRQWRKQGGAVGAAASRMRAAAKQTLGAATRLSEAASIFGLRQPLWGLKGASSPFLVDPARRNRWWFSGSLLTSKENN